MSNRTTKKLIPILIFSFLVLAPQITHADFLKNTLWAAVNGIFGLLLQLSGSILNYAINNFVIGFADEYTSSVGVAIDSGWALVRDVMNMVFIFGLLYIGFKIILDSDDSRTRSMLVNLIVAALLVNFSLFITKFVVDVSNSLASTIAISGFAPNGDVGPDGLAKIYTNNGTVERYQVNMSGDLMQRMGISTAFDANFNDTGTRNDWGYIFGTALLLIISSFVFAAGGILLIIRYVALNFFILFSPFMFIGWAFPPLARYTSAYWKGFLGRAFFAPVYFLLLYFSLQIIGALSESRNLSSFKDTSYGDAFLNGNVSVQSSFPFFIVAIIALLASLVTAQKLGADGASTAISMGKNGFNKLQRGTRRMAGGATFGVGASLGRNTIGRAANAYGNSETAKNLASRSAFGRIALKGSDKIAGASFDARRVGGLGKAAGIGEGAKGGYAKLAKDRDKARKELDKRLGNTDPDTPENKLRADKLAAKIKAEKGAEKTEKEREEKLAKEMKDKILAGSSGIETELTETDSKITNMNKLLSQYEEQLKNPSLTIDQRNETERKRDSVQNMKSEAERRLTALSEAYGTAQSRDALQKELNETIGEERDAINNGDPNKAAEIKKKRARLDKEISGIDQRLADNIEILKYQIEEIDGDIKNASKEAKASIKYEKQIALAKSMEKSQKNAKYYAAAAGATALGAGALVGLPAVGLAYGVAAAAATHKMTSKSDVAALKKEYGKNLAKKMQRDSSQKKFKDALEAAGISEKNDSDSSDKKDDPNDK